MANLTKSTQSVSAKNIKRQWHLYDVEGKILGRAATEISRVLQGKHRVDYVPYLDTGDYVVVVNAKKVSITGKKSADKIYTRYSGYPGGLKRISFSEMLERNPKDIIYRAVSGMLPKNKLRDRRLARLFIFTDDKHSYIDKFQTTSSKKQKNGQEN